jgi:hypothetical protein
VSIFFIFCAETGTFFLSCGMIIKEGLYDKAKKGENNHLRTIVGGAFTVGAGICHRARRLRPVSR